MKPEGFETPNTTPVPDIVFDKLLSELTGNELKVLLYIIRRTYGFGKNADAISLSQFRRGIKTKDEKVLDSGCGIKHNRTILEALTSLEEKGYVIPHKGQTKSGDSDTTVYKLRFKVAAEARAGDRVVTSRNDVVTSSNVGSYPTSPRWLPQVTTVVTPGNQQETVLQETDSQETEIQERAASQQSTETRAQFVHPEYSFLAFDDLQHPTVMTIYFVDDDRAEITNKSRGHIAQEIAETLAARGIQVQVRKEKEHSSITIDAAENARALQSKSENDNRSYRHEPTEDTITEGRIASFRTGVPEPPAGETESAIASTSGEPDVPPSVLSRQSLQSGPTTEQASQATSGQKTPVLVPPSHTSSSQSAPARTSSSSSAAPGAGRQTPSTGTNDGAALTIGAGEPRASDVLAEKLRIAHDWDIVQGRPEPRTRRFMAAVEALVPANPTREELQKCRDWLPTTDNPKKPWYRSHGVGIWDVAEKLGQWRQLADMPPPPGTVMGAQWELAKRAVPRDEDDDRWLDFNNYVGNGPDAIKQLLEDGRKLKEQGFFPDL